MYLYRPREVEVVAAVQDMVHKQGVEKNDNRDDKDVVTEKRDEIL